MSKTLTGFSQFCHSPVNIPIAHDDPELPIRWSGAVQNCEIPCAIVVNDANRLNYFFNGPCALKKRASAQHSSIKSLDGVDEYIVFLNGGPNVCMKDFELVIEWLRSILSRGKIRRITWIIRTQTALGSELQLLISHPNFLGKMLFIFVEQREMCVSGRNGGLLHDGVLEKIKEEQRYGSFIDG
jgi:hypothetical protein